MLTWGEDHPEITEGPCIRRRLLKIFVFTEAQTVGLCIIRNSVKESERFNIHRDVLNPRRESCVTRLCHHGGLGGGVESWQDW